MTFRNHILVRCAILGCATLLGTQAAWMTVPDMLLPRSGSGNPGDTAEEERAAAGHAARLGLVRGDLWADFALTYGELTWPLNRSVSDLATIREFEEARATVKRALERSPHDARLWVLLAALDVQVGRLGRQQGKETIDALKMAYYTAPNEGTLSPYRLMIAACSGVLADQELQQLVSSEIRAVLTHKPELRPAILAAYREATPVARSLFEEAAQLEDPALLGATRPAPGAR